MVAMARNRVIGRDGGLPWHLPEDLRRFKALTLGHPLVMGRRTYESIGRPLPGRRSLVLSRRPDYAPAGVEVVPSLQEALQRLAESEEVFVIGGAEVYALALPRADRVWLTLVEADVDGDVLFPPLPSDLWRLTSEELHGADERHRWAMRFQLWERQPEGR